ncbi:MAG: hypothetical protein VW985_06435 [Gammaproteobacteria bacterium]
MAPTLNRTNQWLLLLAVVLLLLLLWQPAGDSPQSSRLTDLSGDEIEQITIQGPHDPPFTLTRGTERGWLYADSLVEADPQKVDALLDLATTPVYDRFELARSSAREQYIAAADKAWVRFNELTIRFGQSHPVGQRRYVSLAVEGAPSSVPATIALIDDLYYHHLLSPAEQWIRPSPLPPAAALNRISLPSVTLTRDDQRWFASPPILTTEQITRIVEDWQGFRATRISLRDNGAQRDPLPAVTLGWQSVDNQTESITLRLVQLNLESQLLRDDQPVIYHLESDHAARLLQLPDGLH